MTKTRKKLGTVQSMKWQERALSEALSWHSMLGELRVATVPAYKAGHVQGFRDAINLLRQHGFILIDEDN